MKKKKLKKIEKYLDGEFGMYPNRKALKKIKKWDWRDAIGMMKFIKKLWWQSDWGWYEEDGVDAIQFHISTGGWSGNEELIGAMKANQYFWIFSWVSSKRGGHYQFEIKKTRCK